MSRIGKQPVQVTKGVKALVQNDKILVEGPKGKLELTIPGRIEVKIEGEKVIVTRKGEDKQTRSMHGTIRSLINGMVKGASIGYKKEMDVVGVGFKVQMQGKKLVLNLGFSHPVEVNIPAELKVAAPSVTHIIVEGANKQMVGEFCANLHRIYPPEPYKGKGIRFTGEEVRKKLGKALAK